MKFKKEKIKSFFKIKGFYIIACLCLTAVGIATYTTFSGTQKSININESYTSSNISSAKQSIKSSESKKETAKSLPSTTQKTVSEKVKSKAKKASAKLSDSFIIPVHGDILKHFSNEELTYSKTLNDLRLHPALDIACDKGTEVNASASGTVKEVANDSFSGNVIVIEHSSGITIRYVGVSPKENITKGTKVTKDTVIGVCSEIPYECEDPSHIHIEVLKNNEFVSPEKILGIE